jgi:hypothetical protein
MLKIKLPKFLRKKESSPIEKELRKYPRWRRKRLREMWEQWEQGKVLKIEEKK